MQPPDSFPFCLRSFDVSGVTRTVLNKLFLWSSQYLKFLVYILSEPQDLS